MSVEEGVGGGIYLGNRIMANYGDTVEDNSGSFDFYHLLVVCSSNFIKERRRSRINLGFFNPHSKPTSEGV